MEKKTDTKFKPGQSGNPAGRKPGKLKSTVLREQIEQHIPDVLNVIIAKALDGDVQSARLLIERVSPPLKAVDLDTPFSLPSGSLIDQARAVVKAVANAEISTTHGNQLLNGICTVSDLTQVEDIEKRIAALEERIHGK